MYSPELILWCLVQIRILIHYYFEMIICWTVSFNSFIVFFNKKCILEKISEKVAENVVNDNTCTCT